MTREVRLADETVNVIAKNPPRLLIIAGATGTGKSTAAIKVAAKSNFTRLISTDVIREILRATSENETDSALYRSSFSVGDSNDAIVDWQDTCQVLEKGIDATINRAMREGVDLVIEGVHIVPSDRLIRNWINSGGIALGVILSVSDETQHRDMIESRESQSFRTAARYLANFERIRKIQDGLIERSKISSWPVIDISRVSSDIEKIEHYLDIAWNQRQN